MDFGKIDAFLQKTGYKLFNQMKEKITIWKKIKEFLFQMIPVMLGVYLGIVAGNWNADKQHTQLKAQVLEKINTEVKSNKKRVENAIIYHKQLSDSVKIAFATIPPELLKLSVTELPDTIAQVFWQGTRTGTLKNSGYQTALATDVLANLDVNIVSLLADIESQQRNYEEVGSTYVNTIINKGGDTKLIDFLNFIKFFS
jgi:hypothetical protein